MSASYLTEPAFDLRAHALDRDELPETVWRVTQPTTQSVKLDNGDIAARNRTRVIRSRSSLARAAGNHFDWWCQRPSCFLSVFTDREHAYRWAARVSRGKTYHVDEVDTRNLPDDIYVFNAVYLIDELELELQPGQREYSKHELIFLHYIPGEAIIVQEDLSKLADAFLALFIDP